LAYERGFGPVDLSQIRLLGDVTLSEAQRKAFGFRTGLIRVEDYFKGTNIRAYGGRPPGKDHDYCWGGCPGAMEEAIEILRVFDQSCDAKLAPVHVVFGKYDQPIHAQPGERVVFIGDCAEYHGDLHGQPVHIESCYEDRSTKDPKTATSDDIFAKMAKVSAYMAWNKREPVIRIKGCPVSVAEQVLTLVGLGGPKNPYFDPRQAIPFTSNYLSWRTHQALRRAMGDEPLIAGPTLRGQARPPQNLPPADTYTPLELLKSK